MKIMQEFRNDGDDEDDGDRNGTAGEVDRYWGRPALKGDLVRDDRGWRKITIDEH
jgi:hypothetical protein